MIAYKTSKNAKILFVGINPHDAAASSFGNLKERKGSIGTNRTAAET